MVKKMNKEEVMNKFMEMTGKSKEEADIIAEILERNSIIGKVNKEKIITEMVEKLNVSSEEADELYNKISSIIMGGIKDSILHPFKSKKDEE